ncbi:lysophospholipid acyltransferase family protein [Zavarzinella formosa]|uniref:lysophospholipid acyltransferase family protein n=1 Tax=Zavarzinella formosa TaxID=360055 RepID=UPI00031057AD|nr:lysophospholipid acyltransferase family protein [Zavarzinella formosa]
MSSPIILRLRFLGLTLAVGLIVWTATVLAFFAWRVLVEGHVGHQETSPSAPWLLLLSFPAALFSPVMGYVAQSGFRRQFLFTITLIIFAILLVPFFDPKGQPWISYAGLVSLFTVQYLMLAHVVLTELKFHLRILQLAYVSTFVILVAMTGFLGGIGFVFSWANMSDPAEALKLLLAAVLVSGTLLPISLPETETTSDGFVKTMRAGSKILWKERYTRYPLLMIPVVSFLITLTAMWILRAGVTGPETTIAQADTVVWERSTRFALGLLLGWVWSLSHPNTFRSGYLFPHASVLAVFCAGWLIIGESRETPVLLLGICFGSVISPLWNWVSNWTTPGWHGVAAMWLFGGCAAGVALAGGVGLLGRRVDDIAPICLYLLLGGTLVMAITGWAALARPMMEGSLEFLLLPMYHVHRRGPGLQKLPVRREPVIYIANHAAWFDPLWLSKSLPAPCTPMMSSTFYDLPVISFLMRQVMGTIRVPDVGYRKEAPEIQEAIAEIDRGNALLIFPEGYLRRKDEIMMRRFGRGIWQILAERPNTPVIACWIEGGWGSFFSHKNGPPTKKKKFDLFRRIDIGFRDPVIVPPEILADQMKTRLYLMHELSMARVPIGLKPLELPTTGEGGDE